MPKFNNLRYATRGISSTLPLMLQIILWGLIDTMEVVEKDYLQIFTLTSENGKQKIVHEQEQPEYRKEYLFPARYHFLIMEGSGEVVSGLPSRLRTRLKNRLHRSVYLELEHYGDGRGRSQAVLLLRPRLSPAGYQGQPAYACKLLLPLHPRGDTRHDQPRNMLQFHAYYICERG